MAILVTGGAGYIGSHTSIELLNAGYDIVVVDNLSNSKLEVMKRIREITEKDFRFYQVDLLDKPALSAVFMDNQIDAVIHFAGLKAVGESVEFPLKYYQNNVTGTLVLCEVMQSFGVKKIVFSSSATVYGIVDQVPIREDFALAPTNPYGRTKLIIERILQDMYQSNQYMSIGLLRYFNPIGAHASGRIGEDPNGIPNNLMPYITQVAVGKLPKLRIFGSDYPTADGTGVRDYIHVIDLALGHLKTLEKLEENSGVFIYNLGTGTGYSVLDVVKAFEKVSGKKIPHVITERRPGDVAECYADPTKAKEELGWQAQRDLEQMCKDSWRWQSNNPNGYEE
ncbi:MAG: UDP-glucose 4-epimerase GalE [Firmicutes bacterium]|nr:UDP-glucose 4-epimerase GalE [Bacillota bacterium]